MSLTPLPQRLLALSYSWAPASAGTASPRDPSVIAAAWCPGPGLWMGAQDTSKSLDEELYSRQL